METPVLKYRSINSLLHRGIVKHRKVQTIVLTLSAHLGISDRNLKSAEVLKATGTQPHDRPTNTHLELCTVYWGSYAPENGFKIPVLLYRAAQQKSTGVYSQSGPFA